MEFATTITVVGRHCSALVVVDSGGGQRRQTNDDEGDSVLRPEEIEGRRRRREFYDGEFVTQRDHRQCNDRFFRKVKFNLTTTRIHRTKAKTNMAGYGFIGLALVRDLFGRPCSLSYAHYQPIVNKIQVYVCVCVCVH